VLTDTRLRSFSTSAFDGGDELTFRRGRFVPRYEKRYLLNVTKTRFGIDEKNSRVHIGKLSLNPVKGTLAACGYEVTGMILSLYLKGVMHLYRSKDTSVHVSTCANYDFNALTPVVWKLWR
jgi:hypothetical protein